MNVQHSSTPKPLTAAQTAPHALTQSRETGAIIPQSKDNGTVTRKPSPSKRHDPKANFIAGAFGGMSAAILTAPLDVLKTRLQSDFYQANLKASRIERGVPAISTMSTPRVWSLHIRETFQILFAIPRVEGWRALFKGLGPNLVGVVPARAINFFTYGNGKRIISQRFNNGKEAAWVHLLAAANAGIITGTATCPIWVVKTRLQLDRSHAEKKGGGMQARRYRNAWDCTVQTVRHEGIRGLYRGLGASYLGVAESTMQWVMYEQLKMPLRERQERIKAEGRPLTTWDHTLNWVGMTGAAGAAKLVAAVVTYPHEVVRTRLRQAPEANGKLKYTGIIQCTKLIFHEEGMAALYGGLVPHMLRVVPSAVVMFGCYEAILRFLGTDSGV